MTLRTRLFLTAALAASTLAARADTLYNTQSSFNAAAPGDTTVTFGPVPAGNFLYFSSGTTSVGGVGFAIDKSTSNGLLVELGANYGSGHYGTDAVLSSQGSSTGPNNLTITLPTGETSVSLLFNGFADINSVFTTDQVTLTYSDGTTGAVADPIADGSYLFVGLISNTPITSIELTDPAVGGDATLNLAQVQYGSATAPAPEPSSVLLLGTGILSVAGAVRRRFRIA